MEEKEILELQCSIIEWQKNIIGGAYETVQHRTGVSHTKGIAAANPRSKRNVPEAEHTITGERRSSWMK